MKLDEIVEAIGVTPYHREDAGVIYCQNCLDILPKIPAGAIDLVLTDPPYNVGLGSKPHADRQVGYESNDDSLTDNDYSLLLLPIINMTNSHTMIVTPGNSNQTLWPKPKWTMVWLKTNGVTRTPLTRGQQMNHACWEPVLIYGKLDNPPHSDVLDIPISFQSCADGHPCPKPIKLFLRLLSFMDSTIILDPFLGSGTTAVAAKQLGRKFIGIEIEEKYCRIAVKRLAQEELF